MKLSTYLAFLWFLGWEILSLELDMGLLLLTEALET